MKNTINDFFPADTPAYKDPNLDIETRIWDLISRMTPEEKALQLESYSLDTILFEDGNIDWDKIKLTFKNGGIGTAASQNCSAKIYDAVQQYAVEETRLGIPVLFTTEALHGVLQKGCTIFPQQIALASTWEPEFAYQTGEAIAAEARSLGFHEVWTPVLDLARDPRWGRTEEGYGEDTYLAKRFAVKIVKGLQGEDVSQPDKVISEPKHFSAYGAPIGGLNCAPAAIGSLEHHASYLPVFEAAFVEGGAINTMCSYSSVDGIPCSGDRSLLTDLLRGEWGMKGYVRSDMCAVSMLRCDHDVAENEDGAIKLALEAGVDVQLFDFPHEQYQGSIVKQLENGTLSTETVDLAVSRVLRAKFLLGLFEHPYTDLLSHKAVLRSEKHQKLALDVARNSICLLKNQDGLLPLNKKLRKIAVLGPSAAQERLGDYSAVPHGFKAITFLDGIKEIVSPDTEVIFQKGCDILDSGNPQDIYDLQAAVEAAEGADVAILAMGDSSETCGEGLDRADLNLPGKQLELVKAIYETGTPIVLVLQNGRPLSLLWESEHIPAIVEAWFPGEKGGRAIAEVLFGDVNPSGRLPVSFPKSVGQLPVHYSRRPAGNKKYVEMDRKPLYPFGFGMSYTDFSYQNLQLSDSKIRRDGELTISFEVQNIGNVEGTEVPQLYLRDSVASVVHSYMELRGFKRITLKPGETKTIQFQVGSEELKLLNTSYQWVVEPGKFLVMIGRNAEDIKLNGEFQVYM